MMLSTERKGKLLYHTAIRTKWPVPHLHGDLGQKIVSDSPANKAAYYEPKYYLSITQYSFNRAYPMWFEHFPLVNTTYKSISHRSKYYHLGRSLITQNSLSSQGWPSCNKFCKREPNLGFHIDYVKSEPRRVWLRLWVDNLL